MPDGPGGPCASGSGYAGHRSRWVTVFPKSHGLHFRGRKHTQPSRISDGRVHGPEGPLSVSLSLSLNTLLLSSSSLPSAVARVPGRSTELSESQAPPTQTVVKLLDRPPFWRRAVTEVASLRPRGFEPRWRRSGAIKAFLKPQFPSGFFNG